jgi:hypothetical protein|tara:strand:- start:632 stop:1984 length:1353 start_codon:yes stop_codon:yes gene_type:complete
MAFEPKIGLHFNTLLTTVDVVDISGIYNAITNPTGWGSPDTCNPGDAPFDTANLSSIEIHIHGDNTTPGLSTITDGPFLGTLLNGIAPVLPGTYPGTDFIYNASPESWPYGTGIFRYIIDAAYSFGCSVDIQSTGVFTVAKTPVITSNIAPIALDDTFTVNQNSILNIIDPIFNDTDVDGDTIIYVSNGIPSNGTTTFDNITKILTYTPTIGFVGTDTFTYNIADGNGGVDSATITIIVEAIDYTGTEGILDICLNNSCNTLSIKESTTVLNSTECFLSTGWKYDPTEVSNKVYIEVYDSADNLLDIIYLLDKTAIPVINVFPSLFIEGFQLPGYVWSNSDGFYKFKYIVETPLNITNVDPYIYNLGTFEVFYYCNAKNCVANLWEAVFNACKSDYDYESKKELAEDGSLLLAGAVSKAACIDMQKATEIQSTLTDICNLAECEDPGCGC